MIVKKKPDPHQPTDWHPQITDAIEILPFLIVADAISPWCHPQVPHKHRHLLSDIEGIIGEWAERDGDIKQNTSDRHRKLRENKKVFRAEMDALLQEIHAAGLWLVLSLRYEIIEGEKALVVSLMLVPSTLPRMGSGGTVEKM